MQASLLGTNRILKASPRFMRIRLCSMGRVIHAFCHVPRASAGRQWSLRGCCGCIDADTAWLTCSIRFLSCSVWLVLDQFMLGLLPARRRCWPLG